MHLLDTDMLSHLQDRHPRVVERVRELGDPEVGITVVTRMEILNARFASLLKASDGQQLLRAQQWLERSEKLIFGLLVVPFDEAAADHFDRLRANKRLKRIGRADLLIASIALSHRAILATRNVRDFQQVANLRIVNWVDEP
jgi:tRNA(fMet)-specific endonuclease VapC